MLVKLYFDEYVSNLESVVDGELDRTADMDKLVPVYDYARHNGYFNEGILIHQEMSSIAQDFGFEEAQFRTFLGQNNIALDLLKSNDGPYSDNMLYLVESAQLYYYLNDHQRFDKNLKKLQDKFSERSPRILWLNMLSHNIKGEKEKENEILSALVEKYEEHSPGSPAWFLALYYAHLADREKCFRAR